MKRNVLVVDDEPNMRLLIRLILEEGDMTVLEASSGEEALEFLASSSPDVVLLDIRLPGIDGWEVLERMRGDDRMRRIPVVGISAHASATPKVAAERGCVAFLSKPFRAEELLEAMEIALQAA